MLSLGFRLSAQTTNLKVKGLLNPGPVGESGMVVDSPEVTMGGGGRHNRNTLARAHEPMLTKVIVKLLTEDC